MIKKIFPESNSADSDMKSCIFLFILLKCEQADYYLEARDNLLKIPTIFSVLVSYCVYNGVLQNDLCDLDGYQDCRL